MHDALSITSMFGRKISTSHTFTLSMRIRRISLLAAIRHYVFATEIEMVLRARTLYRRKDVGFLEGTVAASVTVFAPCHKNGTTANLRFVSRASTTTNSDGESLSRTFAGWTTNSGGEASAFDGIEWRGSPPLIVRWAIAHRVDVTEDLECARCLPRDSLKNRFEMKKTFSSRNQSEII